MSASSPVLIERVVGRGHRTVSCTGSLQQCDIHLSPALVAFAALLAPIASAEDAPKDVKGIYLMSDFPAVTVRPGETSTVNLKLHNYAQAPERLALVRCRCAVRLDRHVDGWGAADRGGDAGDQFQRLA